MKQQYLSRGLIWLTVALCFGDTGLRSHAYCTLLDCRSKPIAKTPDSSRQDTEPQAQYCGCQSSDCQNEQIPTDTNLLSHFQSTSDEGMPACPCPQNCWCRQSPQPQVLRNTAAWDQFQQQTVLSMAVAMPLVVDDAAFRSISTVSPVSLSKITDLCATLCRYLV